MFKRDLQTPKTMAATEPPCRPRFEEPSEMALVVLPVALAVEDPLVALPATFDSDVRVDECVRVLVLSGGPSSPSSSVSSSSLETQISGKKK